MRNDTGIFNSKSYLNEYKRSLRQTTVAASFRFTVGGYIKTIAGRHEAALVMLQAGGLPALKAERRLQEYERQMTELVEFAEDEEEAGSAELVEILKRLGRAQVEYPQQATRRSAFVEQVKVVTGNAG